MSKESPLDLFSSSAKKKGEKVHDSKNHPKKGNEKRAPIKEKMGRGGKNNPESEEAFAILKRIEEMNTDLTHRLESTAKETGKTVAELESLIDATMGISAIEKKMLKQFKKDFLEKVRGVQRKNSQQEQREPRKNRDVQPEISVQSRSVQRKNGCQ